MRSREGTRTLLRNSLSLWERVGERELGAVPYSALSLPLSQRERERHRSASLVRV
jgi:hypothetical protein